MRLPRHPAILALGFRPEAEKWDALTGATGLVMPSPHESFSFVILEAWSQGTPVLATARSPVLRGHLERSGGGLLYDGTSADFAARLDELLADEGLRKQWGERGRAYVVAVRANDGIARTAWSSCALRVKKLPEAASGGGCGCGGGAGTAAEALLGLAAALLLRRRRR